MILLVLSNQSSSVQASKGWICNILSNFMMAYLCVRTVAYMMRFNFLVILNQLNLESDVQMIEHRERLIRFKCSFDYWRIINGEA
jgi:hypothetical protein